MKNYKMFETKVINLKDVSNTQFIIPTYQRPYVWEHEQIEKLLFDCASAFSTNCEEPYFIGSILTDNKKLFSELIDGQQRFTTMWLIAVVYNKKGLKSDMVNFLFHQDVLRLDFEIRLEVKEYFELLLKHPQEAFSKYNEKELKERPYLENITKGVASIEGILASLHNPLTKEPINLISFGDYLYSKVVMVNNITPTDVDLNKLFATINNSGIQLEQTDIVKSKLLNKLKSKKIKYSKIWEACENMNDFFERNVRKSFPKTNWNKIEFNDFRLFDENVFMFESLNNDSDLSGGLTIKQIAETDFSKEEANDPIVKRAEDIYCESIINFGQLLLHTYRLHLKIKNKTDFEGTFHVGRLIEIFNLLENEGEEDIKEFIELLWEVRFVFDKNIVKWVTNLDTKERHLELTTVSKTSKSGNSYFNRLVKEDKSDQLMLQSVLYFTGDYLRQFWLTPYLYFLLSDDNNPLTENDINELENIDNQMSLTLMNDKEASFFMIDQGIPAEKNIDLVSYLNQNKGTGFKHYWFQKLEYLLWKNWPDRNNPKFKSFRITSKNSVEHIFPQSPEFKSKLEDKYLHSFGNLVLLSVSQNSEYSRKDVNVKREEFKNKNGYDSLKSLYLFNSYKDEWKKEEIEVHKKSMINIFKEHYRLI